ncbi:DUF5999 family protein (plasmid) [Streptomyces sp. BI20]|uniref:DUF5999 family protein n=1 Tax=Streptomyces sp. BI20 TaxID=3403460 RepID=UPI003C7939F0
MCTHQPACPPADATDREAAQVVTGGPEHGVTTLCNGVLLFEDGGGLLPDGGVIAPRRPGVRPRVTA